MNFEELYGKYINGTATEEEKAYVEDLNLVHARLVE